jgi:GT2 family glycosyltransferase
MNPGLILLMHEPFRSKLAGWAKRGIRKWELEGSRAVIVSALRKVARHYQTSLFRSVRYDEWIARNEPDADALRRQCRARFAIEPLISLVTPVYNTPVVFLEALLRSVRDQTYQNWELCIADGGSDDLRVREILKAWVQTDPRIKVRYLEENRGIAENSNAALSLATGEFVSFIDHDDTLAPFALHEIVGAVNRYPDADIVYSDEDKIDGTTGQRCDPHFKPAWSPDLLRACNYITHMVVIRRRLLDQVGGFRAGFEGSQDYDLILRTTELARRIVHVPHVLYHWRMHAESMAENCEAKLYAYESARKALREHLDRCKTPGSVRNSKVLGYYHTTYEPPRRPLVSLIIPNRDQIDVLRRCLYSLWLTDYQHFEIVIVENGSRDPRTHAYYSQLAQVPNVSIVEFSGDFNYSTVTNLGVRQSRGEIVVQLNNDTQAINSDWLERMVEHALRPEVGAVGAKLYYPDNRIQHAGVIVGLEGVAGHAHCGAHRDSFGYAGRLVATQNCSAVTGACLMTRRNVFEEVGGLDEDFPFDFNDVDFCLKIRERGYLNVWTPLAELYHVESQTRGAAPLAKRQAHLDRATRRFQAKWKHYLSAGDPYYSPNLSLSCKSFEIQLDSPRTQSRGA